MQAMYCSSQVSIFQQNSLLGLVQPVSAGVLEMSTTHLYEHTHGQGARCVSVPLSVSSVANTTRDKR